MGRIKRKALNLFAVILLSFLAGAFTMYSLLSKKESDTGVKQTMVEEKLIQQMEEQSQESDMMIELPEDVQRMTEEQ